jgi:superfamily II DNA or RNA helicase
MGSGLDCIGEKTMTAATEAGAVLPALDPDLAYISDYLWLPRKHVPVDSVKVSLQYYTPDGRGGMLLEKLCRETSDHIIVPREYIPPEQYSKHPFQTVDLRPEFFPDAGMRFTGELWNEQVEAAQALATAPGGILNLSPGKGKTVLALHRAAQLNVPTLVVTHNTQIFDQWYEDEIPEYLQLPEGTNIGRIQGAEFDWQQPIAVAMIHTLAKRVKEGRIPPEFRRWFGLVIFDEVHHLAARFFNPTAPLILGERLGLTATLEREDHQEFIITYHLGDILYQDLSMDMIPDVFFQLTPTRLDVDKDKRVLDIKGKLSIPRLRSTMGEMVVGNEYREHCIRQDLADGRKVFAISHSKQQCIELASRFPGAALLIDDNRSKEDKRRRMDVIRGSQLTFSIAQLGTEGMNDPKIDSLHWLTPFKNRKDLRQGIGRLQRFHPDKQHPKVVIYDDVYVSPLTAMCRKLKTFLRELGLTYRTLPAPQI